MTVSVKYRQQPSNPGLAAFGGGWDDHADRHCVWIVSPPGYLHSRAFDEVALSTSSAFAALGGSAPLVRDPSQFNGRSPIIYGGNLLTPDMARLLPSDSIIVNLEQVSDGSEWMQSAYMQLLKRFPVLDYSPRNRDNLIASGISHAELLEIGYEPVLTRIQPAGEQDIDILFYGSMNQRRFEILRPMRDLGLRVVPLFNVYGEERDAAIARAKIVMNIHHYQSAVFEIVRVSYLLANRVCVLTEGDPEDPDVAPFKQGIAVSPYHRLIERCQELLANETERRRLSAYGFAVMKERSQATMLLAAMNGGGQHR